MINVSFHTQWKWTGESMFKWNRCGNTSMTTASREIFTMHKQPEVGIEKSFTQVTSWFSQLLWNQFWVFLKLLSGLCLHGEKLLLYWNWAKQNQKKTKACITCNTHQPWIKPHGYEHPKHQVCWGGKETSTCSPSYNMAHHHLQLMWREMECLDATERNILIQIFLRQKRNRMPHQNLEDVAKLFC